MLPVLPQLTFLMTEHCNLNCKSCGHFSSIADSATFAAIEDYRADLRRLKQLFVSVGRFWLMGGEPLLHPEPWSFIRATREEFPDSWIFFTTNGLLLNKVSQTFWQTCRETGTFLEISAYPSFDSKVTEWRELAERNQVQLILKETKTFFGWMNMKGNSDPRAAMKNCRGPGQSVPMLKGSRLYVCTVPATIHYFNRKFDVDIPSDSGIDLHETGLDGLQILQKLDSPVATCRFCSESYCSKSWERGNHRASDWDAHRSGITI